LLFAGLVLRLNLFNGPSVISPLTDRLSGVDGSLHIVVALALGRFLVLLDVVQLGHSDLLVSLLVLQKLFIVDGSSRLARGLVKLLLSFCHINWWLL
jgi:hypothetical protein